MGKIRTKIIGDENLEKKQKQEAKLRAEAKKIAKKAEKVEKKSDVKEVAEEKKDKKPEEKIKKRKSTKKQISTGRSEKYKAALKKIDKKKIYTIKDAVKTLKAISYAKFDESVELHLNTLETGLKGEVTLPHSTGKTVKVAIVDDALLEKIDKGQIDFDVLISHPSFMAKLAKYARVLGPKGLMPNPKAGTIGPEPEKLAEKFKKGSIRWKTEAKAPIIHQMIGKLSAEDKVLIENASAFISSVEAKNITKGFLTATMTPSLQIAISDES